MTDKTDYYAYLDELRESGETNMFGAGAYLMEEFGLKRKEASEILLAWMKQFKAKPKGGASLEV